MQFRSLLRQLKHDVRGSLLVLVLVFGAVAFTVIIGGVASYALTEHRASNRTHFRDRAFHIAEAGIDYYRWHLAHDPEDYQDGTGQPGPYVHEFEDKDGNVIGYYSLEITPPPAGSTIVFVRSTGWTVQDPSRTRTIEVRLGFPALTDYTFIENTNMIFSYTTEVHGKVHSNGGIEFNGVTDSLVESAQETYNNGYGIYPGVWGDGGPSDFFTYPVPSKDFNGVTADLAAIETLALDDGVHLNNANGEGWHIVFLDDGTFDLYEVDSRECYYGSGFFWWWWWIGDVHCFDIGTETFVQNYAIPANGAIFSEDDVWVEGTVDGWVSIGAGQFPVQPATYRDIYITGNILYEQKSSDDVLGLIAQGDIIVPYDVPNDMEINAAALSQFNKIYRPYYSANYNPSVLNSLLFFGSQISFAGGGWKWVSSGQVISGFVNTNHTYDGNLRYFPPPGFPVEASYELITWEEIME